MCVNELRVLCHHYVIITDISKSAQFKFSRDLFSTIMWNFKKNFNSFSFSGGINIRQSFKRRLSWCLWIKNCVALRHNILQRNNAYTSRPYNRVCGIEDVLTTKRLKWNLPTPKASQSSIFLFTRSGTRNPRTDGLRMLL